MEQPLLTRAQGDTLLSENISRETEPIHQRSIHSLQEKRSNKKCDAAAAAGCRFKAAGESEDGIDIVVLPLLLLCVRCVQ